MSYMSKSPWVMHYDASSCNGCDIEVLAALCPGFDAERFGVINTGNPKHADILLITGSVNDRNISVVKQLYEQMVEPKVVVACGVCACTGGIFHDNYCVWGGTDKILPVDVYIPGCPPTPGQTVYGFAMALGMLAQKQHATNHFEGEGEVAPIAFPDIPYKLRVELEREARRMSGYRYGRDLVDEFMGALENSGDVILGVNDLIAAQSDPRRAEVYEELKGILLARTIGDGHGKESGVLSSHS